MALLWYSVVVDCHDIGAQARWWAETLDWKVGFENAEEVVIAPHDATEERVDVGQTDDATWTVLADPEGNEFCVLSSRDR